MWDRFVSQSTRKNPTTGDANTTFQPQRLICCRCMELLRAVETRNVTLAMDDNNKIVMKRVTMRYSLLPSFCSNLGGSDVECRGVIMFIPSSRDDSYT
jgi:hypothetical protein